MTKNKKSGSMGSKDMRCAECGHTFSLASGSSTKNALCKSCSTSSKSPQGSGKTKSLAPKRGVLDPLI